MRAASGSALRRASVTLLRLVVGALRALACRTCAGRHRSRVASVEPTERQEQAAKTGRHRSRVASVEPTERQEQAAKTVKQLFSRTDL